MELAKSLFCSQNLFSSCFSFSVRTLYFLDLVERLTYELVNIIAVTSKGLNYFSSTLLYYYGYEKSNSKKSSNI